MTKSTQHPESAAPNPGRMIESLHEAPRAGPGHGLEVEVADVVQDVIGLARQSTDDEQFVLVHNSGMSSTALGDGALNIRLCPGVSLEIEDDHIREVLAMLVLTTIDK